ncbi:uncharacterized protein EDB93DRAFT_444581 [Suillus bovinus]|uniref:uncharacterized protein n=1 Tax=Suillus bovinus TaxID=48563 RepID=UPI001B869023|nr:uncharacterized protein EDB93DRAFT_444581 [Suillus bovinus]KAG2159101.1 hypothetical protein EDB93DRAFT_444581 [Suillus bovinus]
MNTDRSSENFVAHDMPQGYNRMNPILIDRDILHDHDTDVIVHPCHWDGCPMHIAVDFKHISKHLQQHHGIDTSTTSEDTRQVTCLWTGCLNTHMKPGNLPRHILSHLGVRWMCSTCGALLSREDAFRRHALEKERCKYTTAVVKYGGESLVISRVH